MAEGNEPQPVESLFGHAYFIQDYNNGNTYTFTIPHLDGGNHSLMVFGYGGSVNYINFYTDGGYKITQLDDTTITLTLTRNTRANFTLTYSTQTMWGGVRLLYLG